MNSGSVGDEYFPLHYIYVGSFPSSPTNICDMERSYVAQISNQVECQDSAINKNRSEVQLKVASHSQSVSQSFNERIAITFECPEERRATGSENKISLLGTHCYMT